MFGVAFSCCVGIILMYMKRGRAGTENYYIIKYTEGKRIPEVKRGISFHLSSRLPYDCAIIIAQFRS